MLNLFKTPPESFHTLQIKLFKQEFTISYKFYQKEDDFFIDDIFYYGEQENELLNAYLNLMLNRGLDMLDRISVKEFDYYLRKDPQRPYFDKISKELLELISLGEQIKKIHKKNKSKETKIYDVKKYGPYEFMSLGEKLELIEEVLSHSSLVNFNLACSNVEDKTVYLRGENLNENDQDEIKHAFAKLGLGFLKVDI